MHSEDDASYKPSKGEQKREAEAAQALGAELVELSAAQLTELFNNADLPEKLREAVTACRTIRAHGARRRQLQYIGKLMRGVEPEPIQSFLSQLQNNRQAASAQHHQLEHWRERLLIEGEAALDELVQAYPATDANAVRKMIASAKREAAQNQPPRAARLLFKYLRELMLD